MFRHLLVPLDRSLESEEALEPAASIALAADATLELVLVREQPLITELPIPLIDRSADEAYLRGLLKRASLAGLSNATYSLLDGDPVAEIKAHAQQEGADLIVMTSHFRTGVSRAWSGSVADGLVRESGVPVLMLRVTHAAPATMLKPVAFKRILVPLDGSAAAAAVLPSVRALAMCDRAQVLLLRIVQPPTATMSVLATPESVAQMGMALSQVDFEVIERATRRLLSEAIDELDSSAAQVRAEGVTSVSWFVDKNDNVADGIVAFAAAHAVDLIAMSTSGRGASRVVVGSVADEVLGQSGVPVLLQCPAHILREQPHLATAALECQMPGLVA